ncbi:hypothetical protein Bca52824_088377 [Brassica carinata]|nr:hypothetical protein Bca52824_088377 [Brassica carinata]
MQARMDTQQQRLDSRGFAGCDGGGNPTLQRALAESEQLGMSQPDPGEERLRPNPQPTTSMTMIYYITSVLHSSEKVLWLTFWFSIRSPFRSLLPPPNRLPASRPETPAEWRTHGRHALTRLAVNHDAATVNVNRLATHLTNLEEGSVYSLTGFEVTHCNQNYRLSDSSLLIRFTDSTSFKKVTEPAVPIPLESFRFRNYSEILLLTDLIGEITAVKSTVTDPPQDKNRVMATIRMDNDTSVTMSLFDAQVSVCVPLLSNILIVVFSELCMGVPKDIVIFVNRLVERDTGLPPVAPLLKSYAKVEKLSISELNDFVVTATSQEIDFICAGKVTGVKLDKGWCYVSCSKCFKKLQRSVSSLTCMSCNNTSAVGVLRYRVEMSIADETGEGLFVAFDGVIAKLHNMRAHEAANLLAGDDVNPEETDAPPFVRDMEGKSYTFQVKVGPYNFTANHQSFTISRILGEGERAPQPEFVEDGGDDDNGDDNDGAGLVRRKMKDGGCSKSAGPSAKSKKARKA